MKSRRILARAAQELLLNNSSVEKMPKLCDARCGVLLFRIARPACGNQEPAPGAAAIHESLNHARPS